MALAVEALEEEVPVVEVSVELMPLLMVVLALEFQMAVKVAVEQQVVGQLVMLGQEGLDWQHQEE